MAMGWRDQYLRYREFYLNISNLYKQRADLRAFLEIMLSIGTVIIFLVFALKPTALTIISLYNEIQEKKSTIAVLDTKINNLQTASGLLSENQNLIPDVDNSVSNAPQPDLISGQLQALATKDSVTILGVSIGQVTLVGNVEVRATGSTDTLPNGANPMLLSVSARGDYANLVAFLKDIENLRLVTKIDGVGINSSTSDNQSVIVTVVTGRVPYIGQVSPAQ